jgi:hypothetical protein
MRPVKRSFSSDRTWASDLLHPLPLAAVAVLAINDHLLKGSGILPGSITGKLSDVAGLFFFPVLLAAAFRGVARLCGAKSDGDLRAFLAVFAPIVTGAGFAAVKLSAFVNARVAETWGFMTMDATDLWTLLVLPLSAAFLLRSKHPAEPARSASRRALDFAAVLAAGLASAATSAPRQPQPPPPPPQEVAAQVAAAPEDPDACASLTLTVCERSASRTFLVVEAAATGRLSCTIQIERAAEVTPGLAEVEPERLPRQIVVKEGETSTFSLTFLRPVGPEELTGIASLKLMVSRAHEPATAVLQPMEIARVCVAR